MPEQTFEEKIISAYNNQVLFNNHKDKSCASKPGYFYKEINGDIIAKFLNVTPRQYSAATFGGWKITPVDKHIFDILSNKDTCFYTLENADNTKTYNRIEKVFFGKTVQRFIVDCPNATIDMLASDGWSIHEVIFGNKNVRMAVDIDMSTDIDAEISAAYNADAEDATRYLVNEIVANIQQMLSHFCVTDEIISEPIIYGYDNEKKHSRHIIFKNAILPRGSDIKFINSKVCDRMDKVFSSIYGVNLSVKFSEIVDLHLGNDKKFTLRLPYCSKNGDYTKILYPMNDEAKESAKYYSIQASYEDANIDLSAIRPDMPTYEAIKFDESSGQLNSIKSAVSKYYPSYTVYKSDANNIMYNVPAGEYCYSCQRAHSSAHKCVVVCDKLRNQYKLCCFIGIQQDKKYNCIIRAHKNYSGDADFIIPLAKDEFNNSSSFIEVNAPRCTDAIADDFKSSYIISASWCSGKSYFISRAVEYARQAGQNIICISSRKTLSTQQCENWDLVNYESFEGILCQETNKYVNFQIESLGMRVNPTGIKNTVIIIDEITALALHCIGRHSIDQRVGLNTLSQMLPGCVRYIVADNDINDSQISAFILAAPAKTPLVYKNSFSKFKGIPATAYVGKNSNSIGEQMAFREICKEYKKMKNGEEYNGVCISHHSKKGVDKFIKRLITTFPDAADKFVAYTSETGDDIRKKDFSNATKAWAEMLCVIYSPCVSIGISADVPHIKTVYGIFQGVNTAQQSAQSLFRCREITNIKLFLRAQESSTEKFPSTYSEFMKWASRENMPIDLNGQTCYNYVCNPFNSAEHMAAMLNNFVGRLFVQAKIQEFRSRNNFLQEISTILNNAGIMLDVKSIVEIGVDSFFATEHDLTHMKTNRAGNIVVGEIYAKKMIMENAKLRQECESERLINISEAMINNEDMKTIKTTKQKLATSGAVSLSIAGLKKEEIINNVEKEEDQKIILAKHVSVAESVQKNITSAQGFIGYAYGNKMNEDNYSKVIKSSAEIYECAINILGTRDVKQFYNKTTVKISAENVAQLYNKFATYINGNALRIFNDRHASDRAKQIKNCGLNEKIQLNTLNIALSRVGLKLSAEKTTRKEKTGNYEFVNSAVHKTHEITHDNIKIAVDLDPFNK